MMSRYSKMRWVILGHFWLLLLAACLPQQRFETKCYPWISASGAGAKYCVTVPPEFDLKYRYPIVYFLHGAGSNEKSWEQGQFGKEARDYAISKKYGHPIVVSFSFGPIWLLNEGHFLDIFTHEFMPLIEGVLPYSGKRGVWGMSMGGFNGFQLYLKQSERFHVFTLACPAVMTISHFSTPQEIYDYNQRTGADPTLIAQVLPIFSQHFPTPEVWARHDILGLARQLPQGTSMAPLAFSCGDTDQFGFQEGNGLLSGILKDKEIPVFYEQLTGPHCVMNVPAFVDFQQTYLF